MELHIAGFDVACMWDNGAGYHTPDGQWHCSNCGDNGEGVAATDHMLLNGLDEKTGVHLPLSQYRLNPVHHGMEMMAQAQSQEMLTISTNGFRLHGFASRNQTTGALQVFLINKYGPCFCCCPVIFRCVKFWMQLAEDRACVGWQIQRHGAEGADGVAGGRAGAEHCGDAGGRRARVDPRLGALGHVALAKAGVRGRGVRVRAATDVLLDA